VVRVSDRAEQGIRAFTADGAPATAVGGGRDSSGPVASRIPPAARAFDLAAVVLLAPLLLPLCLLVSLMVFLDSPGSVFYRARRIGLGGRPFSMLKFRTMRTGSIGPSLTREDDDRFTPIGRFLARARLDELPQVWHVLRGEMRVVGPRPEDPGFVEMFSREYEEILSVPPGIMGRTQLIHFADAATLDPDDPLAHYAEQILPRKLELDADYVRRRSLWADLLIVGQTVLLPWRVATDGLTRFITGRRAQVVPYLATAAIAVVVLAAYIAAAGPAR
jgi:lipopolysaccharide/colanic/teichoic acid biosynthesis glycosyltransferase